MNKIITDCTSYLEYHQVTGTIFLYNKEGFYIDGVFQNDGHKKPLETIQEIIKGHNPNCEYPIEYKNPPLR